MNVACVKLAVDELLNQSAFSSDNNNCPIIYILLAISKTRLQVGILITYPVWKKRADLLSCLYT